MAFKDPEQKRKYLHDWYLANKERIKERDKERRPAKKQYLREYHGRNLEHAREYNKQYREKKRDALKEYGQRRYLSDKERFIQMKIDAIIEKGGKCALCGYLYDGKNMVVFDFHHKNPEEKLGNIAHMQNHATIAEELKKCDLLCANCHRLIHHAEV